MSTPSPFRMSQGLDVLQPKSGPAYPIPCDEWRLLKKQLTEASETPFFLHTLGSILLGAALATVIGIFTDTIPAGEKGKTLVVAWAISAVTGFCGGICLWFATLQNKVQRRQVADVIAKMELIENRHPASEESAPTQSEAPKLVIKKATWGAKGKHADVTAVLARMVNSDSLTVAAKAEILGDPIYGSPKTLSVEYSFSGKDLVRTIDEGAVLKIPG